MLVNCLSTQKQLVIAVGLTIAAFSTAHGQSPETTRPAPATESGQLREELEVVQQKIAQTHEAVSTKPEVKEAEATYYEKVNEVIVKSMPDIAKKVERHEALRHELEVVQKETRPSEAVPPEVQQKVMEYQSLEQELAPVRTSTLDHPEVQQVRDEYSKLVMAEMEKEEPGIKNLLKRQQELISAIQNRTPQQPGESTQ